MTTCLRPIFPGQTNAILAVIFHQKQHETNGKQYLNQCTHNKTTTTTLAAILTNDFLSMRAYVFAVRLARAHGTRKIYMVGVWKVFNCFGGFTWSSVNKNLWMRNCKRVLFSLSLYICATIGKLRETEKLFVVVVVDTKTEREVQKKYSRNKEKQRNKTCVYNDEEWTRSTRFLFFCVSDCKMAC